MNPDEMPRCEHGCPWAENHDLNCVCMADCQRCPDVCKGPHGANLYVRQRPLMETR